MEIPNSDLDKMVEALQLAKEFHEKRDEMNSRVHKSEVVYSELTTTLQKANQRLNKLLDEAN